MRQSIRSSLLNLSTRPESHNVYKFALLSNVIPPSWSGQSVLLGRLLGPIDPSDYIIITVMDPTTSGPGADASIPLPASTFHIPRVYPGAHSAAPATSSERYAILRGACKLVRRLRDYVQLQRDIRARATQLEGILREHPARAIIACTGDFYDIPAASLAARRTGAEFIPYILDDYAHQWTGWLRPMSRLWERIAVGRASRALVTNAEAAAEYHRRYGIHPEIVHNLCPIPDLSTLEPYPLGAEPGTVNIVYTGAIYHAHFDAFRDLVEALDLLTHHQIRLHLFTAQPTDWLAAEGIAGPKVIRHEHVPVMDIQRVMRQADILFMPLAFRSTIDQVLRTASPNKLGEYLASERPILIHAPSDTFLARYFREHNCGIVVEKQGPQAVADAIEWFIRHPEEREVLAGNARQRAVLDYDEARIQLQFAEFVASLAERQR